MAFVTAKSIKYKDGWQAGLLLRVANLSSVIICKCSLLCNCAHTLSLESTKRLQHQQDVTNSVSSQIYMSSRTWRSKDINSHQQQGCCNDRSLYHSNPCSIFIIKDIASELL